MKNHLGLTPDQIASLYKLKRKMDRRKGSPTLPLAEYLDLKPVKVRKNGRVYLTFSILILMGTVLYFQLGL